VLVRVDRRGERKEGCRRDLVGEGWEGLRDGGQGAGGSAGRTREGLRLEGEEVAHNAGPHLPRHETDHDIDVAWVPGSPEDEERGAISELPVPVLDDTVAGILPAVFVHHDRAGDAGGRPQLHISR
jgi:hypothetical protein